MVQGPDKTQKVIAAVANVDPKAIYLFEKTCLKLGRDQGEVLSEIFRDFAVEALGEELTSRYESAYEHLRDWWGGPGGPLPPGR